MKLWLWLPAFGAVIYLLYRRGIAVTKSVAAVFFAFRPGKRGDSAALNSCSGWVQHAGRFCGNEGTYTFTFNCRLTKGEALVWLLNEKKEKLLCLNRQLTAGSAEIHRGERYYLRWEFMGATGKCTLHWQC